MRALGALSLALLPATFSQSITLIDTSSPTDPYNPLKYVLTPGDYLPFSYTSTGAALPLEISIRPVANYNLRVVTNRYDAANGSAFFIYPGDGGFGGAGRYDMLACDTLSRCSLPLPLLSGAWSLNGVYGHDFYVPYAPGSPITYTWKVDSGATLPLSITLRDYFTDSVVALTWTEATSSGTSTQFLTNVPPGVYDLWLCDAAGYCANSGSGAVGSWLSIMVGSLAVTGVQPSYPMGADMTVSWATEGAALPLQYEFWDSYGFYVTGGPLYDSASAAAGTGSVDGFRSLYAGDFYFYICDAYTIACDGGTFLTVTGATSGMALSGVAGYEDYFPYAPGSALSYTWAAAGAALPLTVSIRDYWTDSTVFASWEETALAGTATRQLPDAAILPPGYYVRK